MPLLGKEKYTLAKLPPNLPPDQEVFYCSISREAFLTYEEYFERQFLYSSLLWTCSITGKTGLTYAAALKSEYESKSLLSSIPRLLQKVLLHLMTYMNTFSTNVTISLLCDYTNFRYFIGENIHVLDKGKKTGIIRDVIPPSNLTNSETVSYGLNPLYYKYKVEFFDSNKHEVISANRISRSKCILTREKIRLFLKQHLAPKNGRYDMLNIKEESLKKHDLYNLKWEDIFKGPPPNFNDDTLLVKPIGSKDIDENAIDNDSNSDVQMLKKKSNLISTQKLKLFQREEKLKNDPMEKRKYVRKKLLKKSKIKIKVKGKPGRKKKVLMPSEENVKSSELEIRNRERECRKKYEEDLKSWMEKRDDLLCDDLKPLPECTPIKTIIEDHLVGDALTIIDFINVYHKYISFPNNFPFLTFDYFQQILLDNNVEAINGFSDLLLGLLSTISNGIENEIDLTINENDEELENNINVDDTMANNSVNQWVTTYFSSHEQLFKLKLDCFTLPEILRIYILKTRNIDGKIIHKICPNDLSLVNKLSTQTVFELDQSDRIKLLNLLLVDIVKVPSIRNQIEVSMEEMFKLKTKIRHLNASYARWLKDNPIRQRLRKKKILNNNNQNDDTVVTSEEKEKYKKDKAEKEKEMRLTITDLKAKIRKLSSFCRSRPFGMDRLYRKYWIFETIPGLFVENCTDAFHLNCFENPNPKKKPKLTDYLANGGKRKKKLSSENDSILMEIDDEQKALTTQALYKCSGNKETCNVHSNSKNFWSFYTKEQVEPLLDSLNARGYRESELKSALEIEKSTILANNFEDFDPFMLNQDFILPTPIQDSESLNVRKSERQTSKKQSKKQEQISKSEQSPGEIYYDNFQRQILILEDNIFNSCLCSFSTADRDDWYVDMDKPYNGSLYDTLKLFTKKLFELAKSVRPFCLIQPLGVYPDSGISSPSSGKENIENNQSLFRVPIIPDKWFEVLKVPNTILENIEDFDSYFGITNVSQLFVNLYLLERSLNWDMSASKTASKCNICKRKADDSIILCDYCNGGFHPYCLTPPVKSVNDIEGDWYCYKCLGQLNPKAANKNTEMKKLSNANIKQETAEESIENAKVPDKTGNGLLDRCKFCNELIFEPYSEVSCKTCGEVFHLKCVNLTRAPRVWNCLPCQHNEQFSTNDSNGTNGDRRRSMRKRKSSHYHEYENNLKTKRYDDIY